MTDVLLERLEGGVLTLTMNRPETKNALDKALVARLEEALARLPEREEVRVVILTGAGGSFCSGADLKAAMADPTALPEVDQRLDAYQRIIQAIALAPQPVIAMIDGSAVGFGCDLALACDLRTMSDRAYLQEKFVRIGLMPDGGGTRWLPRLIGTARALELMLTGEPLDAARAEALGVVNRVTAADSLEAVTLELARRIAGGPPLAHLGIKRAVSAGSGGDLAASLAAEREHQLRCLRSNDFLEGVSAWMEKREPTFRGR
jgi:2-(1,2-epoxy-1,2-dihydrophenyl)acetyl-CoA isomerase